MHVMYVDACIYMLPRLQLLCLQQDLATRDSNLKFIQPIINVGTVFFHAVSRTINVPSQIANTAIFDDDFKNSTYRYYSLSYHV